MENSKDLYADYNHERYAHYRNIKTGSFERQEVKSANAGVRLKPITKEIKVSFDEVKELKLDRIGNLAPNLDTEDFTIVSNYLVDFWGAIMGDSVVSVYLHLKRYAYGKKDYCYPDIDLIALKMGKSKNAVKGYLSKLEEHGFIAMFLRRDTDDRNRDVSPLFKIRRYIPLITKDMYDSLHPKMQKMHDEFMKSFEDVNLNNKLYSTNEVIEDIVDKGEVINNKEMKEKIEKVIKEGQMSEYILAKLSVEQREDCDTIHEMIRLAVSKPSYETWVKHSIFIKYDEFNIQVLANNDFSRDWLENHYMTLIKEVSCKELNFSSLGQIDIITMKDYLNKLQNHVV